MKDIDWATFRKDRVNLTLEVHHANERGEPRTYGYWTNGVWAREENFLWDRAVKKATEKAKEINKPVDIAYMDGPVVGGVVPHTYTPNTQ